MAEIPGEANTRKDADTGVSDSQQTNTHTPKARTAQHKGKRVPVIELPLGHVKSVHPSERLPQWAKPLPGEDTRKYAERLGFAIHQDSLDRSLRGDTAAHAKWREQALKGLGLGQRTELDVTAHHDDKWLTFLTDAELQALDMLHKTALHRMSAPQIDVQTHAIADPAKYAETVDSQESPVYHNDHYQNQTNKSSLVGDGEGHGD